MDNSIPPSSNTDLFSNKNTLIFLLVALLVLSFLGINLISIRISNVTHVISFNPITLPDCKLYMVSNEKELIKKIFDILAKLKQELKETFPYKVIDVDGAEADDIIGTLVPIYARDQKILILSSDGDFLQLQQYGSNVKQYNPSLKKYVKSENPLVELKEKIIRGDKGDGIPNMFSASDCFVRDLRQKPITKGVLEKYLNESVEDYSDTDKANFSRNSTLIDLTKIPQEIKQKIINTYDETKPASRQKLLNYFIEHKLKNLMDVIEEF